MSPKADERVADFLYRAKRGERVGLVREALALSGDDFAALVNRRGRELGLAGLDYDKWKVSRVESGEAKQFSAEEAFVIASLDPRQRGIEWLVTGEAATDIGGDSIRSLGEREKLKEPATNPKKKKESSA